MCVYITEFLGNVTQQSPFKNTYNITIKNISTSINVALHRNSYVTGSHLCKNIQSQSTVNPTAYDFYYIIK